MRFLSLLLLSVIFLNNFSLEAQEKSENTPEFLQYQHSPWVDSIMNSLSPDERIAQLIMVAAYSNMEKENRKEILKQIREQKIGGLIFMQGGPVRQVQLMNEYQATSKVPLLGGIDAEWGLGMRLDSTLSYPYQMALGAIRDDREIYNMGAEIARQIKRVGLHMNFAPVVDVNNNAENPVINYRSFGENKYKVANKGIIYMRGLQDNGVLPTAKHFPGHGDTDVDSHLALPQILHTRARLDSLELFPFREIINAGIGGIMVAHLDIPALDSTGVPSTLSNKIITTLLQEELGFEGLIVTDAMNMKGVTKNNLPGIVDKDAILAGNDLLEFTEDVPGAIAEIRKAVDQGLISQEEIDRRVRKILALKQWVGLDEYEPVPLQNLAEDLHSSKADYINKKLSARSLTLLKNENNLLPLDASEELEIAVISVGGETKKSFTEGIKQYARTTSFDLSKKPSEEELQEIRREISKFDLIITAIHDDPGRPYNRITMSDTLQNFIAELAQKQKSVIVLFKNAYVIKNLKDIENADALLVTYQDNPVMEDLAARALFGKTRTSGRLPVSVGEKFKEGDGLWVNGLFPAAGPCRNTLEWLRKDFPNQPVPWCLRR